MQAFGKSLTAGVTVPIMAIGAAAQAAWYELDEALDTVAVKTGATGDDMLALKDSFDAVFGSLPVDAQVVGDAIGEVNTQFGLMGEELEVATDLMIKFSEINGYDVTQSSIAAKAAMEAFNLETSDLQYVLDSTTHTAQGTGQGVDSLLQAVTRGAPQIKALGLEFDVAVEMMGRMEQKGIEGTKALNYMSRAQVQFAKDGKDLASGMSDLQSRIQDASSEAEQLSIAAEYFGTRGASFMLNAIKQGALDFDAFAEAAEDAQGLVLQTFDETLDPADQLEVAMNNLKIAGAALSTTAQEALAPTLQAVAEKARDLSEWIENLDDDQRKAILRFAALAAAIGPTLVVAGKLTMSIGNMVMRFAKLSAAITKAGGVVKFLAALFTGPGFIISAVILGIIAAGVLLVTNWDKIKAKAEEVWLGIGDFFTAMGARIKIIGELFMELVGVIADFFMTEVSATFEDLEPIIRFFGKVIMEVVHLVTQILRGLLEFLVGVFTGDWRRAWNGIKEIFGTIWDSMKDKGREVLDWLIGKVNELLGKVGDNRIVQLLTAGRSRSWGNNAQAVGQHWQGTSFFQGGLTWVHERGAEIIELERGAKIYPHDKSLSMAYEEGLRSAPQYFVSPSHTVEREEGLPPVVVQILGENHFHSEADEDRMAKKVGRQVIKDLLEAKKVLKGEVVKCNAV